MAISPRDYKKRSLQHLRLLGEAYAVLTVEQILDMAVSMDLDPVVVKEMLEEADGDWEAIKDMTAHNKKCAAEIYLFEAVPCPCPGCLGFLRSDGRNTMETATFLSCDTCKHCNFAPDSPPEKAPT